MSFIQPSINDIQLLKNLLTSADDSDLEYEDDRLPQAGIQKFGPGNIGKKKNDQPTATDKKSIYAPIEEKQPKTLEEWEKMAKIEDENSGWDTRKSPDYNIIYKQAVHTEDLFLQMGNKTASTASCENMIIEILLPNEPMKYDEMELAVEREQIKLSTRMYKLKLPLPHRIDPDKGRAQYDSDKNQLKLILHMDREFDYVNF